MAVCRHTRKLSPNPALPDLTTVGHLGKPSSLEAGLGPKPVLLIHKCFLLLLFDSTIIVGFSVRIRHVAPCGSQTEWNQNLDRWMWLSHVACSFSRFWFGFEEDAFYKSMATSARNCVVLWIEFGVISMID